MKHDRANLFGWILVNNLCVLGLHIAISLATFFIALLGVGLLSALGGGDISFELNDPIGMLAIAFVITLGIVAYVYAGYKFLKVLPKHNLLSVSFLALFFMMVGILGLGGIVFGPIPHITPFVEVVVAFLAMSACFIALLVYSVMDFLMGSNLYESGTENLVLYITLFFSAAIPTSFMYLGLRLKIRRQKGSQNDDEDGKELVEQSEVSMEECIQ